MGKVKQLTADQYLLLDDVDWKTYVRFLRLFAEHPSFRLTYDRGVLEIMTISPKHERFKHLLRRLVEAMTDELGIELAGFGSMTCRRLRKRKGLEPDECYWIRSYLLVHGKDHIDLRTDPPPDLALEVDITHSSMDRMAIYAALNIAEVWRCRDQGVTFHVLGADGKYVTASSSISFPGLTPVDLVRFLALRHQIGENEMVRQFRAWVRQQIAAGVLTKPIA